MALADKGLAAAVLLDVVEGGAASVGEPALLAAAGAIGHEDLLPWVLERSELGRHREAVAGALAHFDSALALEGLVRMEASRRMDPGAFLGALRLAAERNPRRLTQVAAILIGEHNRSLLLRFLEQCAATGVPGALPAVIELCGAALLPATERRRKVR